MNTYKYHLKDITILILLTLLIYIPYLGSNEVDGNEPIRIILAKDIIKSSNWFTPMLHGKPYFLKPPLMSWLIAINGILFSTIDEWIARLVSVLATFLTSVSIYILTAGHINRKERLYSAILSLSLIGAISKGRTAEIDSLFISFVVITLLIWFNGYKKNWNNYTTWGLSLFFLAIGFLTKGPQIIGYFYITISAFLIYKRKTTLLFTKAHLFGLSIFFLVLTIYILNILQFISLGEYLKMWKYQITQRTHSSSYNFFEHLATFPLRILLQFIPATILLLPIVFLKNKNHFFNRLLNNDLIIFSLIMIVINFPLYWILPGSRTRYYLPAGPFFCILASVSYSYLMENLKEPKVKSFFRYFTIILISVIVFSIFSLFYIPTYFDLIHKYQIIIFIIALIPLLASLYYILIKSKYELLVLLLSLITGIFFLIYTIIGHQIESIKTNYPPIIAKEIEMLIPENVNTVYEIGYDRFLEISYYINKDIIQLDNFTQLNSINNKSDIYFIFNTNFLKTRSEKERNTFLKDTNWKKLYAKYYSDDKDVITLGYIKKNNNK